jgi:hypothetical protein
VAKSRKPRPYSQKKGNVYFLEKRPPEIEEPSDDVKAQIKKLEVDGTKTFTLDREGRVHSSDVDPLDLYVRVDGAKAASWLIWQHRARFHRTGWVDFNIKIDPLRPTPTWFRVAFEYTRRHSKNFFVYLEVRDNVRHYVFRWEKWGMYDPMKKALSMIAPTLVTPANS